MSVARLANYIEQEQSRGVDIRLSDAQAETIVATLRWAKESELALLEIAHLADDAELIKATGIALRALPIIDTDRSFTLKPIGAPGSPARMMQDYPEEVVNAFIAGISSDDEALSQMLEIINLLDKVGYEIVLKNRLETLPWRQGL